MVETLKISKKSILENIHNAFPNELHMAAYLFFIDNLLREKYPIKSAKQHKIWWNNFNILLPNLFWWVHFYDFSLQVLDLSCNFLEDKGLVPVTQVMAKVPKGMHHLNLSHCSLSSKGINSLCQSLVTNRLNTSSLTYLNLCGNQLRDGKPEKTRQNMTWKLTYIHMPFDGNFFVVYF